jgi:hypothetical protein
MTDALVALLGFGIGIAIALYFSKRRQPAPPKQRFRVEYWIFAEKQQRPSDSEILDRISRAPFARGGIRNEDARMIADIRFNIGRARRDRNAMLFRPDMFGDADAEIEPEALKMVDTVDTIITVRFAADTAPVDPKRYLRLAIYATEAIADLASGVAVWDAVSQRLFSPATLAERLRANPEGAAFEHHVDVRWMETEEAGIAFTRGMEKVGLPDVVFDDQPLDQRILATFLITESARKCWEAGSMEDAKFDGFGEHFAVEATHEPVASPRHAGPVVNVRAYRYRPVE